MKLEDVATQDMLSYGKILHQFLHLALYSYEMIGFPYISLCEDGVFTHSVGEFTLTLEDLATLGPYIIGDKNSLNIQLSTIIKRIKMH